MQTAHQPIKTKAGVAKGRQAPHHRSTVRAAVLEDDDSLHKIFCHALQKEQVTAIPFDSYLEMAMAVRAGMIDIALIDLGIGNEDGMQVIKEVRAHSALPILIVSGRTDPKTVCAGLDCGADDFLRKPFDVSELHARIRGMVRRATATPVATEKSSSITPVVIDGVTIDLTVGVAEIFPLKCHFTDRECHILQILLKTPGKAVSRESISRIIFGKGWAPNTRILDVHVSNIRTKLKSIGASPRIIRTRRNSGYVINANVAAK